MALKPSTMQLSRPGERLGERNKAVRGWLLSGQNERRRRIMRAGSLG